MTTTTITLTEVTKDSPGSGQVTMVGTYASASHANPSQQVTIQNMPADNANWSRSLRLTDTGVHVLRNGVTGVSLDDDSLVLVAMTMQPGLTYAPVFSEDPAADTVVYGSGNHADFYAEAGDETGSVTHAFKESSDGVTYGSALTTTGVYEVSYAGESVDHPILTSDNTAPADGSTVTLGNKTYTFKTTLTPTEGEVLINSTADAALLNLIRAINHTGTPDTDYKCAAAHTQFTADAAVTAHAITVRAKAAGTYATTSSTSPDSHADWAAATHTASRYKLTITPTDATLDGYYYRCTATNAAGSTNSEAVQMTVTAP